MCNLFDRLARAASHFSDQPKKHKLCRGRWDLSFCQVSLQAVQRFQVSEEKSKMSKPIRGQGSHLVFPICSKNTNLVGHWSLASCQVSSNSLQQFQRRSQKCQPIRGQGGHLVFPIGPENTNLVEGVEIFLPVKFRSTPFSGFRGEVKNVSVNQRPGRPFCFSNRPEKHKSIAMVRKYPLNPRGTKNVLSGIRVLSIQIYVLSLSCLAIGINLVQDKGPCD